MSDPAFDLLRESLTRCLQTSLWLVDENIDIAALGGLAPQPALQLISNRFDLADQLRQRGFAAQFSDFDLDAAGVQGLQRIIYRVSKEKALVHHVINAAARLLAPGGELLLSGMKNDGTKTYIEKAAARLGGAARVQRGQRQALLGRIVRTGSGGAALDDQRYGELRLLELSGGLQICSKPGQFGWNKVDAGSALLIEQLPAFLASLSAPPQTVADIGCGYGYLSLQTARQLDARFIASDNNAAAVAACRENFRLHGLRGEVLADNCAASVPAASCDLVLCNPPFHQGFDTQGDLTRRFIAAAARLCRPGGAALFVVNSFVALERASQGLFARQHTLINNRQFKVLGFYK